MFCSPVINYDINYVIFLLSRNYAKVAERVKILPVKVPPKVFNYFYISRYNKADVKDDSM